MRRLVLLFLLLTNTAFAQSLKFELDYPEQADFTYQYVPVRVPPGTHRISVRYSYRDTGTEQAPNSVVDVGLFDTSAFRGWSGGKRDHFFVGEGAATPGYIAGPVEPGEWRVVFGLYKVAPGGVSLNLQVDLEQEEGPPEGEEGRDFYRPQSRNEGVFARGRRYYRGDLHTHSVHSDGDRTLGEVVEELKSSSLDFLALTEHNTYSHHLCLPESAKTIILGEEVTTHHGHANILGLSPGDWYDFRVERRPAAGHLKVVNHPFLPCKGCGWSGAIGGDVEAIEVWNGDWDLSDEAALLLWDQLLAGGRHIIGVAGSDSHKTAQPFGHPCVSLWSESASVADLLAGLRSGRVSMYANPELPELDFRCGQVAPGGTVEGGAVTTTFLVRVPESLREGTLTLVTAGDRLKQRLEAERGEYVFQVGVSYDFARIELRSPEERMIVLTNPIFSSR